MWLWWWLLLLGGLEGEGGLEGLLLEEWGVGRRGGGGFLGRTF